MFQQNVFQGPGTGSFSTHTFEIIFMLLVAGLIGLWLGWVLWSKYRQTAEKLQTENISLNATLTALRQENEALKTQTTELEAERTVLENRVQGLSWESETQRNQFTILQSDLEKLLAKNRLLEAELGLSMEPESTQSDDVHLEINTGAPTDTDRAEEPEVAQTEEPAATGSEAEAIDAALSPEPELVVVAPPPVGTSEGVAFIAPVSRESMIPLDTLEQMPDPPQAPAPEPEKTEPEQTSEQPVVAVLDGPRDDLKIVEGIGPKIEQLLFKAGITTYGHLAATSVQQLKDILSTAGPRYAMHDPGTWSAQALLAANGEWENLTAYQDFLNAGKRPDKN